MSLISMRIIKFGLGANGQLKTRPVVIPNIVSLSGFCMTAAWLVISMGSSLAEWEPTQQTYLKASNTGAKDRFGYSVAVLGDTVVVGAFTEEGSNPGINSEPNDEAFWAGAVYVFVRDGDGWSQQAYLKPSHIDEGDTFGDAVGISGDTIVVGASGEDSSTSGVNSVPDEEARRSGAAYVFVRDGDTWTQQAYLKAIDGDEDDYFGLAVAIAGDTIVIGARGESSSIPGINRMPDEEAERAGAAYIFERQDGIWSQQAYLKASNPDEGDRFGCSVDISGDTVVVGARFEDSRAAGVNPSPNEEAKWAGAAYVFVREDDKWSQQAYLKASDPDAGDNFGHSVAISGDTVIAGAYGKDRDRSEPGASPDEVIEYAGAAYVFVRQDDTWTQQAYLQASDAHDGGAFGYSVSLMGDMAVVGATDKNLDPDVIDAPDAQNNLESAGAAYVFTREDGKWTQQNRVHAFNADAIDHFGNSVAVYGDIFVVGAWNEDSSTKGVNSKPDKAAESSGAAYIFQYKEE